MREGGAVCNVREEERKKERQKGEGGVKYDGNPEREKKRESERERQGGRENEREREEERGTEIGGGEESWKEKNRKEVEKKKQGASEGERAQNPSHSVLWFNKHGCSKRRKRMACWCSQGHTNTHSSTIVRQQLSPVLITVG